MLWREISLEAFTRLVVLNRIRFELTTEQSRSTPHRSTGIVGKRIQTLTDLQTL